MLRHHSSLEKKHFKFCGIKKQFQENHESPLAAREIPNFVENTQIS